MRLGKKARLNSMLPNKKPTLNMRYKQVNIKGWKKIYHPNTNSKKAGVVIITSNKVDFREKNITGVKSTIS